MLWYQRHSYLRPFLHRQREDEVEPQRLGSTLAQSHHVDGGIPQATHLFGGIVTIHVTLLIGGVVTVPATRLIASGRTPHTTEGGHTPPMTDVDHIPPLIVDGHTRLTMAAGIIQGLHTATEGGGHHHMTVLFHHTTAGADIDLSPGHLVLPQGREAGAIPAVCPHREAPRAAVPQSLKDQLAILQRKGMVRGNPHAADLLARGVVQGKATLTAAVLALDLSLGSVKFELWRSRFELL